MQLTISSDDRLEDVLRVLGALHQVDLGAELRAAAAAAPTGDGSDKVALSGEAATPVGEGAAAYAESDRDGFRTKTRHGKAY